MCSLMGATGVLCLSQKKITLHFLSPGTSGKTWTLNHRMWVKGYPTVLPEYSPGASGKIWTLNLNTMSPEAVFLVLCDPSMNELWVS